MNQSQEIGSVYIFLDSLSSLLETNNDEAPILNNQGDPCGSLKYSLTPIVKDDNGHPMNLMHVENVQHLLGKKITVSV
jgi:hypothetical protein